MCSPIIAARPNPWIVTLGMLSASFFPRSLQAFQVDVADIERSASVSVQHVHSPEIEQLAGKLGLSDEATQLSQAIFSSLQPAAKNYFLKLAERQLAPGEFALLNRDEKGNSLLQNLAVLTSSPFHPELEKNRSAIIESFLLELAWPGQLNQGNHGTCGTGLKYPLYLEWPAEAARIMTALLAHEGLTTVKNGALIKRARYVLESDHSETVRSIPEKIMQSALMELANGPKRDYCNHCDEHFDPVSGEISGSGLHDSEIAYLYQAIFGQKSVVYARSSSPGANNGAHSVETLLDVIRSQQPGFIPAGLHWHTGIGGEKLERKHIAEKVKGQTLYNEPHHVLTGGPNRHYGPDGYHFVLVTEIRDGRVYFRNLHGPSNHQPGSELAYPPRRVEDPQIGLESMTLQEFSTRLRWVMDRTKQANHR